MGEKHKDSCGTNFVGRHLLLGSMDPVSTKSKSWFDEIIWKQIDLSIGFPSVEKFSEMTGEIASIPRSLNCFLTPNLLPHSVYWEGQRRWSHIFFLLIRLALNSGYPPILNRYVKATMLYIWRWTVLSFKVFENVCIVSLKVLRHLCGFSFPDQNTSPCRESIACSPPSPLLRHLSVLTPLQAVELMPDHCKF